MATEINRLRDAAQAVVDSIWTDHDEWDVLEKKIEELGELCAEPISHPTVRGIHETSLRVVEELNTGQSWNALKDAALEMANEVVKYDQKINAAKELGLL